MSQFTDTRVAQLSVIDFLNSAPVSFFHVCVAFTADMGFSLCY